MDSTTLKLDTIVSDGVGASEFGVREIKLTGDETRHLSEQIQAVNFRMRISPVGYNSDYHVAGDPTLLVILKGQIVVTLASGHSKGFGAGDMFVAEDYLEKGTEFRSGLHGHKAKVVGSSELTALHLKLERR